jgi:hypothetical protein
VVILLSESTIFTRHPLKCCLVLPKDLPLGSTYLFITVLCNSMKHAKYHLIADTIRIAHSISFSTESTLPQSDIDSIRDLYAADFMKLNTDETEVRCTMLTTYCL